MIDALDKGNEIALKVEREMATAMDIKRNAFIATLSPSQKKAFRELEDLMIQEAAMIQGETIEAFLGTVH